RGSRERTLGQAVKRSAVRPARRKVSTPGHHATSRISGFPADSVRSGRRERLMQHREQLDAGIDLITVDGDALDVESQAELMAIWLIQDAAQVVTADFD